MTLINVWTRDFTRRVARAVATTEHREYALPPIGDLAMKIVRPAETIEGIRLTLTNLTPEFRDTLIDGLTQGVVTIEDEQSFAFLIQTLWFKTDDTIQADAIPMVTALRRYCLPDWYVPDERFC